MKRFQILLSHSIWLILIILLFACSDSDSGLQTFTINFEVQVGGEPLEFESRKYLSPANQSINFERIKVYLSNIELINSSGANDIFYEDDSYHLLSFDLEQGLASIQVKNIPASFHFNQIKFGIGVDSEANTSIDQLGDLDPTNGMAWDWNTGYKFLLLEGRYFAEGDDLGEEIKMHIGTDFNYVTNVVGVQDLISVEDNPEITLYVNALVPIGTIDFSEGTVFMNDDKGDQVARNYKNGFISLY